MSLGHQFDEVLVAARSGNEAAWAAIYRDLSPTLLGYIRGRGAPDPENLMGEVFLQVVRDLPGFGGQERDFRSWVFTIAHNRLLDDVRRRQRRPLEVTNERTPELEAGHDPEAETMTAVETAEVLKVLNVLSAGQRDVLLMRLLGGMTVDEVARALDKTPGAVKALQRRALDAAKRALASRSGVTP